MPVRHREEGALRAIFWWLVNRFEASHPPSGTRPCVWTPRAGLAAIPHLHSTDRQTWTQSMLHAAWLAVSTQRSPTPLDLRAGAPQASSPSARSGGWRSQLPGHCGILLGHWWQRVGHPRRPRAGAGAQTFPRRWFVAHLDAVEGHHHVHVRVHATSAGRQGRGEVGGHHGCPTPSKLNCKKRLHGPLTGD